MNQPDNKTLIEVGRLAMLGYTVEGQDQLFIKLVKEGESPMLVPKEKEIERAADAQNLATQINLGQKLGLI